MKPKADLTSAETIASNSLAGGAAPEISRVTGVSEDEGRFLPGTLLGGRYRILALLGRGGMGEVYRAMDLTLGQSVALKFLPEEATRNQRLLERFHGEVRVARLVSHPNVCRVYDIGEIEGMPFISMEYVDGEDLASLLMRIGRLPADKAVDTARRLCAGLAAAHDRGVIHRDLKPQNIMMNKRGEVVIIGKPAAAVGAAIRPRRSRRIRPPSCPGWYMPLSTAMAGCWSSGRSRPTVSPAWRRQFRRFRFFARSVSTRLRLHDLQEAAHLASMISVAADIDPAVEKIIRRCLDPDPSKRPSSALNVLAALPGGDPLAAALAAGETPSPEMVAAAGTVEGMPRRYSVPCLALVAILLFATIPERQVRTAMVHGGLEQPPDVLAHQARQVAADFGYAARPADSAVWLEHRDGLLGYLRRLPAPHHWDEWLSWEPAIRAAYRESPQPLSAQPSGLVDLENPPPIVPGMVHAFVDGNGRLLEFGAIPADGQPGLAPAVSPVSVLRAFRLDPAAFTETAPTHGVPSTPFDQWRAWKGPHPHLPGVELSVEAAWWKGRIVKAQVFYPFQKPQGDAGAAAGTRFRDIWIPAMVALAVLFVVLMARRNWMRQRADRAGAFHIALASFLLHAVAWAGRFHPVASSDVLDLFTGAVAEWLLGAAILWFAYLALEPEVRARWPHSIVTWNRVLAGNWLDAQVGSHILIGAAVGSASWVFFKAVTIFFFKTNEPSNWDVSLGYLLGARHWIGAHANNANNALGTGIFVFLTIFGMRQLLRNPILAALAAAAIFALAQGEVTGPDWWLIGLLYGSVIAGLIFVLLRCGLLATISAVFFLDAINGMALGTDWNAWYVPASLATLLLLIGIATFAFWRSLGGRELIETG